MTRWAAFVAVVLPACTPASSSPEVAEARSEPSAPPPASVRAPSETELAPHAPERAPSGEHFELADLVGRDVDRLHPATCADAAGWQLEAGLSVGDRALAVRRCDAFRGPHAAVESGQVARLNLISDGGQVVFAVATAEYELEGAQRVAEHLLRTLALAGCSQVYADDRNVGFTGCPGRAQWAAVTRLSVPGDAGTRHAVVLEVARDREIAAAIAAAYAERIEQERR